jgi:hypothetical protein
VLPAIARSHLARTAAGVSHPYRAPTAAGRVERYRAAGAEAICPPPRAFRIVGHHAALGGRHRCASPLGLGGLPCARVVPRQRGGSTRDRCDGDREGSFLSWSGLSTTGTAPEIPSILVVVNIFARASL